VSGGPHLLLEVGSPTDRKLAPLRKRGLRFAKWVLARQLSQSRARADKPRVDELETMAELLDPTATLRVVGRVSSTKRGRRRQAPSSYAEQKGRA